MKTLDTRDLYARKNELESLSDAVTEAQDELAEAKEALDEYEDADPSEDREGDQREELETAVSDAEKALDAAQDEFGKDEQEELAELEELESEISDFRHGEAMIPEYDFEDYARELAEELGLIPDDAKWPATCIDWEQAANELKQDYTSVSYQGNDYYVRA